MAFFYSSSLGSRIAKDVPEGWQRFEWQSQNSSVQVPFSVYLPPDFIISSDDNNPGIIIGPKMTLPKYLIYSDVKTKSDDLGFIESLKEESVQLIPKKVSGKPSSFFYFSSCKQLDMFPFGHTEDAMKMLTGYLINIGGEKTLHFVLLAFCDNQDTVLTRGLVEMFEKIVATLQFEKSGKAVVSLDQAILAIKRESEIHNNTAVGAFFTEFVDSSGSYWKIDVVEPSLGSSFVRYWYTVDKSTGKIVEKEMEGSANRDQAYQKVLSLLEVKVYLGNTPNSYLDFDHEEEDKWVFHAYQLQSDHSATHNWYFFDKQNGVITDFFGKEYK